MKRINIKQFAILSDTPPADIDVKLSCSFKYNLEQRMVGVTLQFAFSGNGEKCMLLELFCEFEIHPEDWAAASNETSTVIPKATADYMIAQGVGVARGVLHCKTEGTMFISIVLPPINVTTMLTDDLVLNYE